MENEELDCISIDIGVHRKDSFAWRDQSTRIIRPPEPEAAVSQSAHAPLDKAMIDHEPLIWVHLTH